MMRNALLNFTEQLTYEPRIENAEKLREYERYIVVGMGGSNLAAPLISIAHPHIPITIHRDYGLPRVGSKELSTTLVIIVSHSGNTEEALDAFETARRGNYPLAAITTGGKLLEHAIHAAIPCIRIPDKTESPRNAIGSMLCALLTLMRKETAIKEIRESVSFLTPTEYDASGKILAETLHNTIPIIYTSQQNYPLAYNWKVRLNETAKIPAFANAIPEVDHNELISFSEHAEAQALSQKFHFIFLKDSADHPRIQRRFAIMQNIFRNKGMRSSSIPMQGNTQWQKIFSSILTADWTSYHLAHLYNTNPDETPLIEEFKKLL